MSTLRKATGRLLVLALAGGMVLACSSDAERREAHLASADEYLAAGQNAEALIELRRALQLDPTSADVNFRIAELLQVQGRLEDALFFFAEVERLDPLRTDAPLERARLLTFDDPDEAARLVESVLEREPANVIAHIQRSRLALVDEELDAALAAALTALELEPDGVEGHQQLGRVYHARALLARREGETPAERDFEAGAAAFRKAIELSAEENRWVGARNLAKLLAAWPGHGEETEAAFREALEAAARSGSALAMRETSADALSFAQQTQRPDLARATLEHLVAAEPRAYRSWSRLARLEEARGGSAEEVYRRMLAELPQDPQAHLLYAQYLIENQRPTEAREHLEAQVAAIAEPAELLAGLSSILYAKGSDDEARQVVERLEREYPDDPVTVMAVARRALQDGAPEPAAEALRELVERRPSSRAFRLLAEAERGVGDARAAVAAIDRAVELASGGPFVPELVRTQARLRAEVRDCEGCLRSLSLLTRNEADLSAGERFLQGRCLYETGRERPGRRILEKLADLDGGAHPVAVHAVLELARREGRRDAERARKLLDGALERRPNHPGLLTARARLDLAANRPAEALSRIDTALAAGRAAPELLLLRARVLAAEGQLEAAEQEALRAFDANPALEGAAGLVVALYRAQGKQQAAIASFEQALEAGALQPTGRYLLAQLHLGEGNRERARVLLEGVLDERPGLLMAKNDLAYLLAQDDAELDRALELAQEAREGLPEAPAVADTLGFVYLRKKLTGPALEQFRTAVALADEDHGQRRVYLYHLGQALQAAGRPDEASAAFEGALALDESYEEARQALEALRAAQPSDGTS